MQENHERGSGLPPDTTPSDTPRAMNRTASFPQRHRIFAIPDSPLSEQEILAEVEVAASRRPCDYGSKQPTAKPGTIVDPTAARAKNLMVDLMNPNGVDGGHMFYGAYELEREALAMTARLLGKTDPRTMSDGFFLSGGTESISQALWTYRNRFYRGLGIDVDEFGIDLAGSIARRNDPTSLLPVVIAQTDAHFALSKSMASLGMGKAQVAYYSVRDDFTTDYEDLERVLERAYAIGRPILANFCTVGDTQKGKVQDVARVTGIVRDIAARFGKEPPPTIVDAAAQYLYAALMPGMPAWDFRVPDVEMIVADPHKNGVPYAAGILLMRDMGLARYTDQDGIYLSKDLVSEVEGMSEEEKSAAKHNSTLLTSRDGSTGAATWAFYLAHGVEGLRARKERIREMVAAAADGIRSSSAFTLIAEPETANVAFRLKDEPTAERHDRIYRGINECPHDRLYISKSTALTACTLSDLRTAAREGAGSRFTGLYLHFMEHNSIDGIPYLLSRLEEEARRL